MFSYLFESNEYIDPLHSINNVILYLSILQVTFAVRQFSKFFDAFSMFWRSLKREFKLLVTCTTRFLSQALKVQIWFKHHFGFVTMITYWWLLCHDDNLLVTAVKVQIWFKHHFVYVLDIMPGMSFVLYTCMVVQHYVCFYILCTAV